MGQENNEGSIGPFTGCAANRPRLRQPRPLFKPIRYDALGHTVRPCPPEQEETVTIMLSLAGKTEHRLALLREKHPGYLLVQEVYRSIQGRWP